MAIRRKLRLPIYDSTSPPFCKCGTRHDCWGDHTFRCRSISKKMAHDMIRDSWALALQPALATAGYIRHSSKLNTERRDIKTRDVSAQPFDISFDPDIPTDNTTQTLCPFSTIGADITITHSAPTPTFRPLDDVISVSARADQHLQKSEYRKYKRPNKKDINDKSITINGDAVLGDILQQNMVLLPFALDPHGRFGPLLNNFLFNTKTTIQYRFKPNRQNAQVMFRRATTAPCPIGILSTADSIWKNTKNRNFFGHSYTSPTPSIFTIQQLGLGITKAFSAHIRNATKGNTTLPVSINPRTAHNNQSVHH